MPDLIVFAICLFDLKVMQKKNWFDFCLHADQLYTYFMRLSYSISSNPMQ